MILSLLCGASLRFLSVCVGVDDFTAMLFDIRENMARRCLHTLIRSTCYGPFVRRRPASFIHLQAPGIVSPGRAMHAREYRLRRVLEGEGSCLHAFCEAAAYRHVNFGLKLYTGRY